MRFCNSCKKETVVQWSGIVDCPATFICNMDERGEIDSITFIENELDNLRMKDFDLNLGEFSCQECGAIITQEELFGADNIQDFNSW